MFKEFRELRQKRDRRLGLPDQLNYAIAVDDHTIALKDGAFLAAFECAGLDLNSASIEELDAHQQQREGRAQPVVRVHRCIGSSGRSGQRVQTERCQDRQGKEHEHGKAGWRAHGMKAKDPLVERGIERSDPVWTE